MVEFTAQIALILCALLFALLFLVGAALAGQATPFKAEDLLAVPALAAAVYTSGVLAVVLIGAPIYAVLEAYKRATVATAVLVGVAPGFALLFVSLMPTLWPATVTPIFSVLYIAFGASVAAATHLFRNRGEGGVRAA
jgi:hypothetical protein